MQDRPRKSLNRPAVKQAIEYGIDVTLLIENLRHTPTERLRRHQQALESMVALREEVQKSRRQEAYLQRRFQPHPRHLPTGVADSRAV